MARNQERTVDKIGGSSMAWPQTAMEIVRTKQAAGRIVVVSAPGADTVGDRSGRMTEMLKAYEKQPDPTALAVIRDRLAQVASRGALDHTATDILLESMQTDIAHASDRHEPIDPLGETWMARAFAQMLGRNWQYLPATSAIYLNESGDLDEQATAAALHQLDPGINYVIDGNQGRSPTGMMTRIGDGGSDVSAAYVRRALGPGVLRIHSDVDGYKTIDPNLKVNGDLQRTADAVPFVTYQESEQLGRAGNGLVHHAVPRALKGTGSNTYLHETRSGLSGTRLLDERSNVHVQPIVGVTGEESVDSGMSSVTIVGEGLLAANDPHSRTLALSQALGALARYRIPLHSVASNGISATFIVAQRQYHDAVDVVHHGVMDQSRS